MLVTVIMTLLGISFLLMGETENLIARNEKRAAQSLYVAEAGARAVKRWFDDPRNAIAFPDPTALDRTQRRIIDETDPYDPADATPANGVIGSFRTVPISGSTTASLVRPAISSINCPGSCSPVFRPRVATCRRGSAASTSTRRPTFKSARTGTATAWVR
jgi:hypothetical protein